MSRLRLGLLCIFPTVSKQCVSAPLNSFCFVFLSSKSTDFFQRCKTLKTGHEYVVSFVRKWKTNLSQLGTTGDNFQSQIWCSREYFQQQYCICWIMGCVSVCGHGNEGIWWNEGIPGATCVAHWCILYSFGGVTPWLRGTVILLIEFVKNKKNLEHHQTDP